MRGVSEWVKREKKKQEGRFLGILLETLGPLGSGNMLTGKKRHDNRRKKYNNLYHMDKIFSSAPSFK